MMAKNQKARNQMTEHTAGRRFLTRKERAVLARLKELRPTDGTNWATGCYETLFQAHRGAFRFGPRYYVVFGNDGFRKDVRSRLEVVKLVAVLESAGIKIKEFSVNGHGSTWAMVVNRGPIDLLDTAVWDSWFRACEDVTGRKFHPFPHRLEEMLAAA